MPGADKGDHCKGPSPVGRDGGGACPAGRTDAVSASEKVESVHPDGTTPQKAGPCPQVWGLGTQPLPGDLMPRSPQLQVRCWVTLCCPLVATLHWLLKGPGSHLPRCRFRTSCPAVESLGLDCRSRGRNHCSLHALKLPQCQALGSQVTCEMMGRPVWRRRPRVAPEASLCCHLYDIKSPKHKLSFYMICSYLISSPNVL